MKPYEIIDIIEPPKEILHLLRHLVKSEYKVNVKYINANTLLPTCGLLIIVGDAAHIKIWGLTILGIKSNLRRWIERDCVSEYLYTN
jgi:hypothetical protein